MARADLTESMAADLRNLQIDLNDERAVIRALSSLRYLSGDIVACMDDAIKAARRSQKNLSSIVGDGAAAVCAIAAWLAWYVVLCPPAVT